LVYCLKNVARPQQENKLLFILQSSPVALSPKRGCRKLSSEAAGLPRSSGLKSSMFVAPRVAAQRMKFDIDQISGGEIGVERARAAAERINR
jgi:hypothetical protein